MKLLVMWVLTAALSLSAVGCGGGVRSYPETSLNRLSIGTTVQQFLTRNDDTLGFLCIMEGRQGGLHRTG